MPVISWHFKKNVEFPSTMPSCQVLCRVKCLCRVLCRVCLDKSTAPGAVTWYCTKKRNSIETENTQTNEQQMTHTQHTHLHDDDNNNKLEE